MKFPKLKNAFLCRILLYVVVLGGFIGPIFLVWAIKPVPEAVKGITTFALLIGCLIYMVKNFSFLMTMDLAFAVMYSLSRARTQFELPNGFSAEKAKRRMSRFGMTCESSGVILKPELLRYKLSAPITVYSSGIERIVTAYHVELLDRTVLNNIMRSATFDSNALKGRKKPLFLDNEQKKSPLNRVTVVFIFADRVEQALQPKLYDRLCEKEGDGAEISNLYCVIDAERNICVYPSEHMPYLGFGYPVKNRGMKLVKRFIFGGRLPLAGNKFYVTNKAADDLSLDMSLWAFWSLMKKEAAQNDKEMTKAFQKMQHQQIRFDKGYMMIKWEDRGLVVYTQKNEEEKTVTVEPITDWSYPGPRPMAKKTVSQIEEFIRQYFAQLGYTVVSEE